MNHNCVAIGRRCDMAAASWGQGTTKNAVMWGVRVSVLRPPRRPGWDAIAGSGWAHRESAQHRRCPECSSH
ncbi:hypothetical protein E1J25_10905 [Xanthomonas hortorum pv. taraxaci]|nr:hypothetical protein [Xanthomonas hortorum pv. taraxaci]